MSGHVRTLGRLSYYRSLSGGGGPMIRHDTALIRSNGAFHDPTPNSSSTSSSSSFSSPRRLFHASSAISHATGLKATGFKDFVPKWLKRDQSADEEPTPEELLGLAPKSMVPAARKPDDKFKEAYRPPNDLEMKMKTLCEEHRLFDVDHDVSPSSSPDVATIQLPVDDPVKLFHFLDACVETFEKRIPNSFVDEIRTVGDALDFFSREVRPKSRVLEDLRAVAPSNVHVIPDYMTFEKEMELYGGRDAYPYQDVIVSRLSEKGKYKSVRKPKGPWEEAQGFLKEKGKEVGGHDRRDLKPGFDMPVTYKRHKGF